MALKKNKQKVNHWLILVLIFFAITLWDNSNLIISKINLVLHPLREKIYQTSDKATKLLQTFSDLSELHDKNEKLQIQVEELENVVEDNHLLLIENKKLRNIVNIKERLPYEIIIAQITYIDALDPYETITIDKGEKDGIKLNMAVTSVNGVIGRIKEITNSHATVELITSRKSYTSAIDQNGHSLSILKGQGNEELNLEYVVEATKARIGDKIYTSGISDIYRKNLYLGEITSIGKSDNMFKKITVKLPYKIFNLKNVMILKKGE